MFDLPELVELGGARRLNVIERRLLGPDSFLRARFAA
jgi:hypothetical protein